MKDKPTTAQLKMTYRDILLGYTKCVLDGSKHGFIKHLSIYDSIDLEEVKEKYENDAKSKGVPTKEEKQKYLMEENLWTKKEEDNLIELSGFVSNLRATKSKLFLKSQIDDLKSQIEEAEQKIKKMELEKKNLIGLTAEGYADKKVNEYYIQHVLYKDSEFSSLLYENDEYEDLDDLRISSLVVQYNETTKFFKTECFKLIALSSFMSNSFYMCDNDPMRFYGKPVVDLTFFQTEVFSHAAYFKHIMSESKAPIPESMRDKPEELIEWFEASKNAEEVLDKMDTSKGGGSSLVGATKDDLERLGLNDSTNKSLSSEAAKRGGKLTMEDFMEIHGQ